MDIDARYQATLDYLYNTLPVFSKIGKKAHTNKLDNIISLMDTLGNPQNQYPTIHVGGTNGKGSTTHYLASMLIESGKNVGTYSSPHLVDFGERIKIGNEMIEKQYVINFVEKIKPQIQKLKPSFFEVTVAMAFDYFAYKKVDIAVIEVGLGGRLDSTNIIHPVLSIVTNVSYDHMDILGDSIESIAFEKAGIIKENTPFVLGESNENYNYVFKNRCTEKHAEFYDASEEILIDNDETDYIFKSKMGVSYSIPKDSIAPYQTKNIRTSSYSFILIQKILYKNESPEVLAQWIQDGVKNLWKNTHFLGRWMKVTYKSKHVIFDSAHNVAGFQEALLALKNEKYNSLKIVIGVVVEKDLTSIVPLLPTQKVVYYVTQPSIFRGRAAEDTAKELQSLPIALINSSSSSVFEKAIEDAESEDLVIVVGSMFLLGDILGYIKS